MKILFISDHLIGDSGWSRYARDLVLESKNNGAEVLCLVNIVDINTDAKQIEVLKKCPIAYISNPVLSFVNAIEVNKIIHSFNPDIVHIIVEPYSTMLPFIKKGKAKIVLTVHSTFAYMPILVSGLKKKISEFITKLSLKKIDAIISVSKYTEDHLVKYLKIINAQRVISDKLYIVSGGVANVTEFINKTVNKKKEILFVGAVKPRKGLLESIEALSKVKTDFVYRVVGKFDEASEYVKLIRKKIVEYGLTNRVLLMGALPDQELEQMYQKADLYLMLSTNNGADFEGFGLVYLEANARGVPVIGPNDSGVTDAIVSGKTGYLVNQYDSEATAKVIDDILEKNLIKSKDCIEWAQQNTSKIKAKKVFLIYNKLIG